MKENLKLGGILLVITLVAGILLGITNELTKEKIALNSKVNMTDLSAVMEGADTVKELEVEANDEVSEMFEVYSGKELLGYAIKVSAKGFKGPIDFVVGISKEDTITGVKVLSHGETPGLGSRIEEEEFTSQFVGKTTDELLEAVKAAPANVNEIEAISGATISSKGTVTAINSAIKYFRENIKGEQVAVEPEEVEMTLEEKLMSIIEGSDEVTLEQEKPDRDILKYYSIKKADEIVGYGIISKAEGYYADIEFAVVINLEGVVQGIEVLKHEETEGLGALITEESYRKQFVGKTTDMTLKLAADVSSNDTEIEGVSSATYSSTASVDAINAAFKFYNNNISSGN